MCPRDLSYSHTRESACFLRRVPHACTTDKLLLTSWVASVNNDQPKKRSGSTYAYSVLDEGYREGMSLQEAAALARRAVRHATYRDAFSGKLVKWFAVFLVGLRASIAPRPPPLWGTCLPSSNFVDRSINRDLHALILP